MKTILFTMTALIWSAYAAPEALPSFKPAPVYKPAESYVADQPQFAVENKAVAVPVSGTSHTAVSSSMSSAASSDNSQIYNSDGFVDNYNGYSAYDQGYGVQTGYEGYLVPTGGYYSPGSSDVSPISYALSLIPHYTTVIAAFGKGVAFLATAAVVVLLGAVAVFALCTFTPFCHIKLAGFNPLTIKEEVRAYMTPDNISAAVNFLRDAINKYQKMQNKR